MSKDRKWYYFTFGCGQPHAKHYVKFFGTFNEARAKMFEKYGEQWAFQYSQEEWEDWTNRCREKNMEWLLETELK